MLDILKDIISIFFIHLQPLNKFFKEFISLSIRMIIFLILSFLVTVFSSISLPKISLYIWKFDLSFPLILINFPNLLSDKIISIWGIKNKFLR